MYKNKSKQKQANKESAKRYRKGMTEKGAAILATRQDGRIRGIPIYPDDEGMTQGMTGEEGGRPDIILKLIDPWWRDRLTKLCHAFESSHHPEYKEDVWLGNTNLSTACDWLECTR